MKTYPEITADLVSNAIEITCPELRGIEYNNMTSCEQWSLSFSVGQEMRLSDDKKTRDLFRGLIEDHDDADGSCAHNHVKRRIDSDIERAILCMIGDAYG